MSAREAIRQLASAVSARIRETASWWFRIRRQALPLSRGRGPADLWLERGGSGDRTAMTWTELHEVLRARGLARPGDAGRRSGGHHGHRDRVATLGRSSPATFSLGCQAFMWTDGGFARDAAARVRLQLFRSGPRKLIRHNLDRGRRRAVGPCGSRRHLPSAPHRSTAGRRRHGDKRQDDHCLSRGLDLRGGGRPMRRPRDGWAQPSPER